MTALYIILGIIALIVILFSIKVSVTAEYADSFSLDVQWLFIKLHIFPQTEEQKAKREAKKAKKEEKKKKKKIEHLPDRVLRFSDVRCQDFVVSLSFVGLLYRRCRTWNRQQPKRKQDRQVRQEHSA